MNLNLHFFSTLDKGPALPVDSEAVSKCRKTTERVPNNLDNCNFRNEIIDTFTVDHLPYKLNSDSVKVISCLSLIEDVGLPYFEKYLKPPEKKKKKKKNLICIPLCDGIHFQDYIVNITEHKIIHIDSLRWKQPKNLTFIQIAKLLFQNSQPTF